MVLITIRKGPPLHPNSILQAPGFSGERCCLASNKNSAKRVIGLKISEIMEIKRTTYLHP
jgi:hypothetical protein